MKNTLADYRHRRRAVAVMFLLTSVILGYIWLKSITPESTRKSLTYKTATVTWRFDAFSDKIRYTLTSRDGMSLVLTCQDGKILTEDLHAMSTVRMRYNAREYMLANTSLDGVLYRVPILSDTPNPTKNQQEYLHALARARTITFEYDYVRYSWNTDNSAIVLSCIDKKIRPTEVDRIVSEVLSNSAASSSAASDI